MFCFSILTIAETETDIMIEIGTETDTRIVITIGRIVGTGKGVRKFYLLLQTYGFGQVRMFAREMAALHNGACNL